MTPGAYIREMRESRGFSIAEVAELIRAFGLDRNRASPWFRWKLRPLLAGIEAGHEVPTDAQLLSLSVLLSFSVVEYRGRVGSTEAAAALPTHEVAHVHV